MKMSKKNRLELMNKLRNPENSEVQEAILELRAHGWLQDGILEGANLKHVHFQHSNLENANLRGADLRMAQMQFSNLRCSDLTDACLSKTNLYGADLGDACLKGTSLCKANLQGAQNLKIEQLTEAKSLWGAILPDGNLYDGRFNLSGDIAFAEAGHIDIHNPRKMAAFYRSAEEPIGTLDEIQEISFESCNTVQLIRKLRNSNPLIVQHAIQELRQRGHLEDGSLRWVYLRYVNLQGLDLSGANLKNTDLNMAKLQVADLSGANLEETRLNKANLRFALLANANLKGASLNQANLQGILDLTQEQLSQVYKLRGTTMPDGSRYDGRFNLEGDLADARFLQVDLNDPVAMANFYDVSVEEYEYGQAWVRTHLPMLWRKFTEKERLEEIRSESDHHFN
jgi:uncharacterized protein YjbI with pentapeptide repeats